MLILSFVLIAVLVGIDQLIKLLVVMYIPLSNGHTKPFWTWTIGDFRLFSLTHIRNDGAGFSILGGQTEFLLIFTFILMAVVISYMVIKRKSLTNLEMICLSLIVAGGLGNFIDRVRMLVEPDFTGVIDYIKTEFINFPIYNFADICVVIGAFGLCIVMIVLDIIASKKAKVQKIEAESDEQV